MTEDEVDDQIDIWHDSIEPDIPLHEFLGWTREQYKTYVECGAIPVYEEEKPAPQAVPGLNAFEAEIEEQYIMQRAPVPSDVERALPATPSPYSHKRYGVDLPDFGIDLASPVKTTVDQHVTAVGLAIGEVMKAAGLWDGQEETALESAKASAHLVSYSQDPKAEMLTTTVMLRTMAVLTVTTRLEGNQLITETKPSAAGGG